MRFIKRLYRKTKRALRRAYNRVRMFLCTFFG